MPSQTEVEQLEAELSEREDLARELAAAERALEQARDAAATAEDEAQAAAERDLEERMAEVDAELEEARQEIAATRSELEEREAQFTETEAVQARSTFGDGVHVVGQDIEPGVYRREGSGLCYWARLSGLSGDFDDIITNVTPDGPATVEINAADVASSRRVVGSGPAGRRPATRFGVGLISRPDGLRGSQWRSY